MSTKLSREKARLKEHVWELLITYQPKCVLCDKPWKREDILPSRGTDNLTLHHVDGNHYNNDPDNRRWAHQTCHKRHHTKNNINFWSQFK